MTVVLAAIDASDSAGRVLDTARSFSLLLGATVRAIHVGDGDLTPALPPGHGGVELEVVAGGDPADEVVAAGEEPDVELVVVGSRGERSDPRPVGHIAAAILERAAKPVLVVPPDGTVPAGRRPIRRALVPLEGTAASSEAVTDALLRLTGAGVDLVSLHVFGPATAPLFWDEPGHAEESFAAEFATRWCGAPDSELRFRRGDPGAIVVMVAEADDVDLIALGWSQNLEPGRAGVVRAVLSDAKVPVLLVPVPRDS